MTSALLALALVLTQRPDPEALNEQARELAGAQRLEEAEKLWQRALEVAPDFFPALFNLGFMYFSRSDYERAEPLLAKAAALQPDDFNSRYLLGSARVSLGRSEAGLREWQAALALKPDNYKLMHIMAVEYGRGRYFSAAAELARRAVELRPDDPNAYFIAIKACQDARDPAAFDIARRAVLKFPDSARANFEYAWHLRKAGRPNESIPYLKRAMAGDPAYEEPFFFYGDSLLQEDRYEEAIGYLRTAIRNRPDYVVASVALARALMEMERYAEAVAELERVIGISPRHPQPHLLLSQVCFRRGEDERARQEKEISLRLRRADPTIMEVPQGRPFPSDAK